MAKRLVGGTAGMTKGNFTHPFVQPNVKLFEPGENQVCRIRLLPAFEKDINGNIVAPDSFIPYRAEKQGDEEHAAFTDWFVEISGYRMLGPNKLRFLSPSTGMENPPGGTDPLVDLYRASRQSDDPAIKWFSEKHDRKEDRMRALQWPSRMYILNALLVNDENLLDNVMLKLSSKGMEALTNLLNNPSTRNGPQRARFDEYCFGDVTAPDDGLWGNIKPFKFNDAGMSTAGVFFGRKSNEWEAVEAFPFDPQSEDGQIFLRGRYDLCDAEKVLKIADKQEMVNAIFSGVAWLPYEWASSVLLDLGYDVPKNPHRSTMVSQPAAQRPVAPAAPAAPARSVAPAARPAAAPARSAAQSPAAPRPAAAPARPAAPTAPAAARPAPRPAAPAAAAAPARPAAAPRPTVAIKQPVAPSPEPEAAPVTDEAAEAAAGLAPAEPEVMTPELEAELTALEAELQADPPNFPQDKINRMSTLVALRDAQQAA